MLCGKKRQMKYNYMNESQIHTTYSAKLKPATTFNEAGINANL